MTPIEARRCLRACAEYLARRDESPRAAQDLQQAGQVLFAAGVRSARADACGQETSDELIEELWGRCR